MRVHCIDKIYMQHMYEAIKIDSEQSTMRYTNLKESIYDAPIVFQNNLVQNTFDHMTLTLSGVGIEVCMFLCVGVCF